nr:MAG TPA: hypothetical protein [Caudoviricetes sp.]DAM51827.1 MAG TPA: hypothetical protein [Caudoviricetes sp.]
MLGERIFLFGNCAFFCPSLGVRCLSRRFKKSTLCAKGGAHHVAQV